MAWVTLYFFADESGDAAAVEPNGVVRKKGWFFVQTNFYQSGIPAGAETCERFKIATRMLLDSGGDISIDLFRGILAATHQEGPATTQYSNVYDLKARVMYLHHFHNHENVVAPSGSVCCFGAGHLAAWDAIGNATWTFNSL